MRSKPTKPTKPTKFHPNLHDLKPKKDAKAGWNPQPDPPKGATNPDLAPPCGPSGTSQQQVGSI